MARDIDMGKMIKRTERVSEGMEQMQLDEMEDMHPMALPRKVTEEIWASVLKGETIPYEDDRGMFVPVQRGDGLPWEKYRLDSRRMKESMEGVLTTMANDKRGSEDEK